MNIEPLFDAATIQQRVKELGRSIEVNLGDKDPWIISIVGESVLFLADLIRVLDHPVRFDFIQVRYSESDLGTSVRDIQFPIQLDVAGEHLVIVKDVAVTGVTENYLINEFRDRGAASVNFVALIDVPKGRRTDFRPDYSLFEEDRKGTFVGYGLQYEGRYGNLPYIGVFGKEAVES